MKNKRRYGKYNKFDVVYADFGRNAHGVEGGIRPGIIVSCDASNHDGAPQVSVVPLSSKLKDIPVHVIIEPQDVRGYGLRTKSDFMPEDTQTISKGCIRGKSGVFCQVLFLEKTVRIPCFHQGIFPALDGHLIKHLCA